MEEGTAWPVCYPMKIKFRSLWQQLGWIQLTMKCLNTCAGDITNLCQMPAKPISSSCAVTISVGRKQFAIVQHTLRRDLMGRISTPASFPQVHNSQPSTEGSQLCNHNQTFSQTLVHKSNKIYHFPAMFQNHLYSLNSKSTTCKLLTYIRVKHSL